jgi:hypothetical protein
VPVNASLLPRTEEEHERCKRTVYVTNIDLGVEARRTLRLHLRHAVALTRGAARSPRRCAASSRRCAARSRSCTSRSWTTKTRKSRSWSSPRRRALTERSAAAARA